MADRSEGFRRLRGAAASVALASSVLGAAGSARAAPRSIPFTLSYANVGAEDVGFSVRDFTNNSRFQVTYPKTASALSSNAIDALAFAIEDFNQFTNGNGDGQYTGVSACDDTATTPATFDGTLGDSHDGFMAYGIDNRMFQNAGTVVDVSGDAITTEAEVNVVTGIDAQLELRVFAQDAIIRGVLAVSNNGDVDADIAVVAVGNVGSDACTTIQNTSNADTTIDASDTWVVSNDSGTVGAGPRFDAVVAWGIQGNERVIDAREVADFGGAGVDDYAFVYNITVPAGQTLRIMNFAALGFTNAEASTKAANFESLADLNAAGLLAGLSTSERNSIANYNAVPVATNCNCQGGSGGGGGGSSSLPIQESSGGAIGLGTALAFLIRRRSKKQSA